LVPSVDKFSVKVNGKGKLFLKAAYSFRHNRRNKKCNVVVLTLRLT
jgi:hypothetical protein